MVCVHYEGFDVSSFGHNSRQMARSKPSGNGLTPRNFTASTPAPLSSGLDQGWWPTGRKMIGARKHGDVWPAPPDKSEARGHDVCTVVSRPHERCPVPRLQACESLAACAARRCQAKGLHRLQAQRTAPHSCSTFADVNGARTRAGLGGKHYRLPGEGSPRALVQMSRRELVSDRTWHDARPLQSYLHVPCAYPASFLAAESAWSLPLKVMMDVRD